MSHRQYSIKNNTLEKYNARLLFISLSKDEKDWQSIFHTHHFTELFFVLNGKGKFLFRDEAYTIAPGDLVIVPPYMKHTEQSIRSYPLEYYALGIDGISLQPPDAQSSVQVLCNFNDHSVISGLFSQMLYEVQNKYADSDLICQNLLEILILRIMRSQQLIPVPTSPIRMTKECAQIKEYLDANYADPITLDTLTNLTHMNKYYMVHSFAKYTGQSPIHYLNQRRIENACTLLRNTDMSISAIASASGFSSPSYFTQIFKKTYGLPPMKYRQRHSDSEEEATGHSS